MARKDHIGSSNRIYFFMMPRMFGIDAFIVVTMFLLSNCLSYSMFIVNMLENTSIPIIRWNPFAHRLSNTANPR